MSAFARLTTSTNRLLAGVPGAARHGFFPLLMLRLVAAGVLTAFVLTVACGALSLVSAPEWVSLVLEPFSLLFLPGLGIAMASSGPHDVDPTAVFDCTIAFYFLLFLVILQVRAWRTRS